MKRLQTRAAAAALSALLLALPTCALAAETAPLTLSTQQNAAPVERRTDLGQLSAFGRSHTYMGVSVSDEWLYQARIGGLPLGLSLFTPEGDGVTFRESSTGIEVRTWGGSNASGQTLQSVLDSYTSAHNVDYKATGKTWVVASWKENGNEYYAKQYVGSNYVNGIEFGYPRTSADAGSAVIEAYINDYHPGDL